MQYSVALVLILASAPLMTSLMYEPSKDFIRSLKPIQSDALTDIMNFFSLLGDGEIFFYFLMFFYAIGNKRMFLYNVACYAVTLYFLSWLKLQFHSSRP